MAKYKWLMIAVLLALPAVLQSWFLVTSEGVLDSGDQLNHFHIARFAWKHPALLLDMWGKPLFTLIAAPFAKAGVGGIIVMNILLVEGMGFFAWKAAEKMKLPLPWLAIPLTGCNPELFRNVLSGHTETLFAFLLILVLYLMVSKRFLFAAIVISFLPFSRPEAWLVMPLLGIVFLMRRQWKWLAFFAVGTVVYSVAGFFHFKDILWVFHQNPYEAENNIYGSGPWYHFIESHRKTWGRILTIGSLAGLAALPLYLFRVLKPRAEFLAEEILVVAGSSLAILGAHSVMWYMGSYGSAGFVRVLTCFAPLMALLTLRGFSLVNPLMEKLKPSYRKMAYAAVTVFIPFWMWRTADKALNFPIRNNEGDKATTEFAEIVKADAAKAPQLYYFHPLLVYLLDLDPDDPSQGGLLWGLDRKKPALDKPSGTLLLWDSKFGPAEAGMPLDVLFDCEHLRFLYKYAPAKQVCYGDVVLEFYVFRRK